MSFKGATVGRGVGVGFSVGVGFTVGVGVAVGSGVAVGAVVAVGALVAVGSGVSVLCLLPQAANNSNTANRPAILHFFTVEIPPIDYFMVYPKPKIVNFFAASVMRTST